MNADEERRRSTVAPKKLTADDFEFGAVLGEGAYAKVLLACRKSTKREYAIKIVDKAHVRRYDKVHEMLNEKKVLSRLDHPYVVKLKFTFQDSTSLYYVLELASRGELYSLISSKGKLPNHVARYYAAQLVDTLEYLHCKNIVHRDLKPENVLIADDGNILLTDFATSKVLNDENRTKTPLGERKKSFVGTAEYVPPELLNDQHVSTSADLWALGCIIYQMHVGQPPFKGDSEFLTFQKIIGREFTFPDDVSDEMKSLVDALLQNEPTERLGANLNTKFEDIKSHPYFNGIDWPNLHEQVPPNDFELPQRVTMANQHEFIDNDEVNDSDEDVLMGLSTSGSGPVTAIDIHSSSSSINIYGANQDNDDDDDDTDHRSNNSRNSHHGEWARFLGDDEEILYRGLVQKHRGIFATKRQLMLTNRPRFLYVDPNKMRLRGEIKWDKDIWIEVKSDRVFYIHRPDRDYYIQGLSCSAHDWLKAFNLVKNAEQPPK